MKTAQHQPALVPEALIFVEGNIEIRSTTAHHLMRGFRPILVFVPHSIPHPAAFVPQVRSIRYDTLSEGTLDRGPRDQPRHPSETKHLNVLVL